MQILNNLSVSPLASASAPPSAAVPDSEERPFAKLLSAQHAQAAPPPKPPAAKQPAPDDADHPRSAEPAQDGEAGNGEPAQETAAKPSASRRAGRGEGRTAAHAARMPNHVGAEEKTSHSHGKDNAAGHDDKDDSKTAAQPDAAQPMNALPLNLAGPRALPGQASTSSDSGAIAPGVSTAAGAASSAAAGGVQAMPPGAASAAQATRNAVRQEHVKETFADIASGMAHAAATGSGTDPVKDRLLALAQEHLQLRPLDAVGDARGAAAGAVPQVNTQMAPSTTSDPVAVRIPTAVADPQFGGSMALQVSMLTRDGVHRAELHLNPAEMGPVSVQIAVQGTQAQVDFGVDSSATRHIIESSLPELATALRDAGFTLSGGGVSQHPQSHSGNHGPMPGFSANARAQDGTVEPALGTRHMTVRLPQGAVDLYA